MRLSGCPEFGQGRDPKCYATRTVFLIRRGSPEGGRPIFPGPWPENCALPVRAAGLVSDALAKAQAPSGVLSVPGARSESLSDFMSDFVPDLVSDFVSGLGPATLGMGVRFWIRFFRAVPPDDLVEKKSDAKSDAKSDDESDHTWGTPKHCSEREVVTPLGAPTKELEPSADSRTATASPLDGNPPRNLRPGIAKKI